MNLESELICWKAETREIISERYPDYTRKEQDNVIKETAKLIIKKHPDFFGIFTNEIIN